MSEEKAKELSTQNNEKKEEEIQKAMERIESERTEMDELRRFGYFTIPYPATVGDKAYSIKDNFKNHKIIDGKIITENRNIFVRPVLKGRTPEVYFQRVEAEPDEVVEQHKEMNKKEYEAMINKVKASKEAKPAIQFKPGGPQETFGFYKDVEQPEPTGTLYIKPDPKRFILEGGKVKTENRNIFTNPTKVGKSFKPDDYFQFYVADDAVQERLKEMEKKDREKKLNQVKERKLNQVTKPPFHPAALKKCEPFSSVIETYGLYNEAENQQLLQEYRDYKKKGNPKYQKVLPKGSVVHDKPFQPARLIYQGRDGLFNDDLYKIPEPTEKDKKKVLTVKERKEIEEANKAKRRVPFTYNKLMKSSTFAPPISSFMTNLRREFPTIKFH